MAMTSAEKAKELYFKMYRELMCKELSESNSLRPEIAKQCAIVAVAAIIDSYKDLISNGWISDALQRSITHYEEVLYEINFINK